MPIYTCRTCGVSFKRKGGTVTTDRPTCSIACRGIEQSKHLTQPVYVRFFRFVSWDGSGHGCWSWSGAKNKDGYGTFRLNPTVGKTTAHRVMWLLTFGPIPTGLCVLHTCDNPGCVKPRHLFLGTIADNNRDRASKDRSAKTHPSSIRGEQMGTAKLTEGAVRVIRSASGISQRALARQFGVSRAAIRWVMKGRSWRHVSV